MKNYLDMTSLIICSRNRPSMLTDVVQSVFAGTSVPDEFLIIDQSNEPNEYLSRLVSHKCNFRYIWTEDVGISRSRNLGVSEASYDIIIFTDDDVLVPPEWFEQIVSSLMNSESNFVVTGRVLPGPQEHKNAFAPSLHVSETPTIYKKRSRIDPLATFNFALHRSAFNALGGFDIHLGPGTRFPSAEDNDFGYRLLKSGFSILYDHKAVVYHRAWRTNQSYLSVRYSYGKGQGGYYAKHLTLGDSYMVIKMLSAFNRRLLRMAKFDRRGLLGEPAWIIGFFAGLIEWIKTNGNKGRYFSRSPDGSRGW